MFGLKIAAGFMQKVISKSKSLGKCLEIVATGFFGSIGYYRSPKWGFKDTGYQQLHDFNLGPVTNPKPQTLISLP